MVQNQHMSKCLVGCRDHAKSRRVATHLDLKVKWMKTDNPDTGDIYAGLDRFGRITDCRWRNTSTDSDLSRTQYGYDRDSNRIWRKNPTDPNGHYDWLYSYDGLQRLKNGKRGTLSGTHDAIIDPQFKQCWSLDATSNWNGFQQSNNGTDWSLVQERTSNTVNEIADITNTTGPAWATPAYDRNGNMNLIPQGKNPSASYAATYDAWNRLTKLTDTETSNTIQENQYDARNFRVVRQDYSNNTLSETRHFYYTDSWQDIEQRLGTSTTPEQQNTWGVRYIDDLVLRDRDTTNNGTLNERLYATQDANWNVTAVVDTNGAVQERYEYDPYGNVTFLGSDYSPRATSEFAWTTLFTGRYLDTTTQLFQFRERYYHWDLGIFVTRDPIGFADGLSLYEYCSSNSLIHLDASGESWGGFLSWTGIGAAVGAVAAIAAAVTVGAPVVVAVGIGVGIGAAVGAIGYSTVGQVTDALQGRTKQDPCDLNDPRFNCAFDALKNCGFGMQADYMKGAMMPGGEANSQQQAGSCECNNDPNAVGSAASTIMAGKQQEVGRQGMTTLLTAPKYSCGDLAMQILGEYHRQPQVNTANTTSGPELTQLEACLQNLKPSDRPDPKNWAHN